MSSSATMGDSSPRPAELSRDQLLDFIKRQKAKIKKLEGDNVDLSQKLSKAGLPPAAASSSDVSLDASFSLLKPCTPLQQMMAKVAFRSLFPRARSATSQRSCFARWKLTAVQMKLTEAEQKLEEATKNATELEKRCLKLKGLLSRTHQANKQQVEDTNAFKRAQREATQELRTHAQEKLALIEEVRARDIESAFHQDLEIFIQKAAEGLVSQHQQMQQQLQSQSQGLVPKSLLKDLEVEIESAMKDISDAQTRESDLTAKLKESKQLLLRSEKAVVTAEEKASIMEKRARDLEKQLQDEACGRREIEVELELTLKSRTTMLGKLETTCEDKVEKLRAESSLQIKELKRQCDMLEKKLETADQDMSKAATENIRLWKEVKTATNSNEITRLRGQVQEFKKLLKGGTVVKLSGGEPMLQEILDIATFFSTQAKRLCTDLIQARSECAETTRYLLDLFDHNLRVVGERVSPYVAASHTLAVLDQSTISSAKTQCSHLQSEVGKLESDLDRLKGSILDPMVWEASSVTIQAGKDIVFPIPMPTVAGNPKLEAVLDWTYSGSQANMISMILSKTNSKGNDALNLQSVQGHRDELKGSHRVTSADGDRTLKLGTTSMWGQITISYQIRLKYESSEKASLNVSEASDTLRIKKAELSALLSKVQAADGAIDALSSLVKKSTVVRDQQKDEVRTELQSRLSRIEASIKTFSELKTGATKGMRQLAVEVTTPLEVGPHRLADTPSSPALNGISVLNCESLKIRAADDFRVYIPQSFIQRPFKLQWAFELVSKSGVDIGFTVLEQQDDGALPTVIPYRRVKKDSSGEISITDREGTIVVLFDNSYSWARSKELRCSIQVCPLSITSLAGSSSSPGDDESLSHTSPVRRLNLPSPSIHEMLPLLDLAKLELSTRVMGESL